jgi:hypothetical protein
MERQGNIIIFNESERGEFDVPGGQPQLTQYKSQKITEGRRCGFKLALMPSCKQIPPIER